MQRMAVVSEKRVIRKKGCFGVMEKVADNICGSLQYI